jgi:hypothetical protein
MKKPVVQLPAVLTYQIVTRELIGCHDNSFFTEESEGGNPVKSSPGIDYEHFPVITMVVLKDKNHHLENGHAYIFARPKSLVGRELFVRIEGVVETVTSKDKALFTVVFRAHAVKIVKQGNDFSTKHTWSVVEETNAA